MSPPWWQPWIPVVGALAGTLVGFSLAQVMERRRRRRQRRAHWAALRAEVDFGWKRAQTYRDAGVAAPLYRLPTITYSKSFPALLADAAVTEGEVQRLVEFFTEVETLNRGLDQAQGARGDDATLQTEWKRNLLKVEAIERVYPELRRLINAHLGGRSMTKADGADYPWRGERWAAHADAANNGLNGQGYVVHSAMLAARSNTRLTWAIIGLMVAQIATAVWAKLW